MNSRARGIERLVEGHSIIVGFFSLSAKAGLQVLSTEIDLAEIRLIRQVFFKERGVMIFIAAIPNDFKIVI
jgi:hypothetical protein